MELHQGNVAKPFPMTDGTCSFAVLTARLNNALPVRDKEVSATPSIICALAMLEGMELEIRTTVDSLST